MRRATYFYQYYQHPSSHQYRLTINRQLHRTINRQQHQHQHQQIMIIAVHSDSVLRCAQTGIRNERSVLGAKREEKMKHQFIRFIQTRTPLF